MFKSKTFVSVYETIDFLNKNQENIEHVIEIFQNYKTGDIILIYEIKEV